MTNPKRRTDPILGEEKLCGTCGEWWPLDEEFWYAKRYEVGDTAIAAGRRYVRQTPGVHWYARCRACWSETRQRTLARRKVA